MPKLSRDIQKALRKLGMDLEKAFRLDTEGQKGDPQWTVTGLAGSVWKIAHPELPLVKDENGSLKDVLLQMHIYHDQDSAKWFVVAQNRVVGPETHASPKALIVAKEDEAPGPDWDMETIAQAAANFFRQQKDELKADAEAMVGEAPSPNDNTAVAPQPGAGGPMASRRAQGQYFFTRRSKSAWNNWKAKQRRRVLTYFDKLAGDLPIKQPVREAITQTLLRKAWDVIGPDGPGYVTTEEFTNWVEREISKVTPRKDARYTSVNPARRMKLAKAILGAGSDDEMTRQVSDLIKAKAKTPEDAKKLHEVAVKEASIRSQGSQARAFWEKVVESLQSRVASRYATLRKTLTT